MYISIFAVIMYWLSIWIMKPIWQFTRKIEINIEQVRKVKQEKHQGKKLSQIQMQVDLMKGFTKSNKEMNSLYVDFNKMAQILAVGHYSNLTENSY